MILKGFCQCGCGDKTNMAPNSSGKGRIKGQPYRFIFRHAPKEKGNGKNVRCAMCPKEFYIVPSVEKMGFGKTCSKSCSQKLRLKNPEYKKKFCKGPQDQFFLFWSKVIKIPGGCWKWTGATNGKGYSHTRINHKDIYPHRFSYELAKGDIPNGLTIDHLCKNRLCVNPEHLEAVTQLENFLRTDYMVAIRARGEFCKKGHPFNQENTYTNPSGRRLCRVCHREYEANRRKNIGPDHD